MERSSAPKRTLMERFPNLKGLLRSEGEEQFDKYVLAKQRYVSRSTTEAEYRSLAAATSEPLWIRLLLKEIDLSSGSLPSLWCDNLSATYLTANPVFYSRTKHMEIDFHYIRDLVQKKELRVQYISSHDQLADILTKPLLKDRFCDLCGKLNLISGST
ncbi:hypothetical protein KY285_031595 [Solanum tuberosum]|nr:hypothetical protein KY285_031595 [Solanum tuberosum]